MTHPDLINCSFEFGGAIAQCVNIRRLLRDRMVRGISLSTTTFFNAWGLWNLYYYLHLEQPWSWFGGAFLTSINLIWLSIAAWFAHINKRPT